MLEEEEHELTAAALEEEDEDEGPPPGFQRIIAPQEAAAEEAETEAEAEAADNEEEDGPPPGFDCITPKPIQSLPSSAEMAFIGSFNSLASSDTTSSKQDDMDDDEDGPPPGWEFSKLVNALPKETSSAADIIEEGNEELDEGPPPGWESVLPCQMPQPHTPPLQPPSTVSPSEFRRESVLPCQMPQPHTPPLQPPSTVSPSSEMGSKQITPKNDTEVPQSGSDDTPMLEQSLPATPPPPQLPSSEQPSDAGNKEEHKKEEEKRPTSWHKPVSALQQLLSNPHPLTPVPKSSASEKAQLVCGTCRKLCLYPRGSKWIRCPGCQEVNFALEAHDVGQVKCGGCTVLLMYPHGAPAVQCSSCRFVTEIGAHNRRPPLSVQQAQARDQRRQRRSTQAR